MNSKEILIIILLNSFVVLISLIGVVFWIYNKIHYKPASGRSKGNRGVNEITNCSSNQPLLDQSEKHTIVEMLKEESEAAINDFNEIEERAYDVNRKWKDIIKNAMQRFLQAVNKFQTLSKESRNQHINSSIRLCLI